MATEPQQRPEAQDEGAVLAALLVVLLAGLPRAQATAYIIEILAAIGIPAAAARQAAALTLPHVEAPDPEDISPETPASAQVLATRPARQAAYLKAAAERIASGLLSVTVPEQPERMSAAEKERRYLRQHLDAERARAEAARKADELAAVHGPVLSWNAVMDDATTAGCREANGKHFHVARWPIVEGQPALPGMVHGGTCRCSAGPPKAVAEMLPTEPVTLSRVRGETRDAMEFASFDPDQPRDRLGRWSRFLGWFRRLFEGNGEGIRRVDARRFYSRFRRALADPKRGPYLTPYKRRDFRRMETYLHPSGNAGGAIKDTPEGRELVSLFRIGPPKGAGAEVMATLIEKGADRLDCIGDGLRVIYEAAGFEVVKTIPWDDEFAPKGWDYPSQGRPMIYVMVLRQ